MFCKDNFLVLFFLKQNPLNVVCRNKHFIPLLKNTQMFMLNPYFIFIPYVFKERIYHLKSHCLLILSPLKFKLMNCHNNKPVFISH